MHEVGKLKPSPPSSSLVGRRQSLRYPASREAISTQLRKKGYPSQLASPEARAAQPRTKVFETTTTYSMTSPPIRYGSTQKVASKQYLCLGSIVQACSRQLRKC